MMIATRPAPQDYGTFAADHTLTIRRRLPGPIARVWAHLTESHLREQWLAAGSMDLRSGSSFELVWRNDRLSASDGERPDGFPAVSRATCRLTEVEAPHKLRFSWPDVGDVTMELEPDGDDVVLTLTHQGCSDRAMKLMIGAGWHVHLDILAARLRDTAAPSFWSTWQALRGDYDRRLPA
jgi:uncharacterized protein YndB with AHSA1/START domain